MSESELSSSSHSDDEQPHELKREKKVEPKGESDSEDENGLVKNPKDGEDYQGQDSSDDESSDEGDKEPKEQEDIEKVEENKKEKVKKLPVTEEEKAVDELLAKTRSKYVDPTEQEINEINEANAKSIVEAMDKAYDVDYRCLLAKQPSFERIGFLSKRLEPVSHNKVLTRYLIKEDILGRLIKWLKGFDGKVPIHTFTELILKILKAYDLKDDDLNDELVTAVREIWIKEGTPAHKLREELITTWRRGILKAKSGARSMKSTKIQIDDKFQGEIQYGELCKDRAN
jgi:hypothetical protein